MLKEVVGQRRGKVGTVERGVIMQREEMLENGKRGGKVRKDRG